MIDEFHEAYMDVLEEYTSEEDPAILDTYVNQPNLIAFFAEELDGEDEDGETLDVEFASQLFIVLAAMAGLYNKAIA
jgi:predicted lipid-binding transport protein (Tim44 family)